MTQIMKIIIEDCKLRGISQKELADRSGLTEVSISRYFNGTRTPNLKNTEKMANALGLTLRLILKGKNTVTFTYPELREHEKVVKAFAVDKCIEIVKNTYRMDAIVKLEEFKRQE